MTHDELLARIVKLSVTPESNVVPSELATALMSVVKLHRPNVKGGCDICSWIINGFVMYDVCPTIQAIEKELA